MKFLFGFISSLIIITAQAQENTCQAVKTGNPCAHATSRSPSLNLGAGNPIHLMSGNKFQQENDMLMRLSGLELTRYYNSMAAINSPYGVGWNIAYHTQLFQFPHAWQILLDDGQRVNFYPPTGSKSMAKLAAHGFLQQNDQQEWEWHTPEGTIRTFNPQGKMTRLQIAGRADIHIDYQQHQHQTLISKVYTQEESLTFHYKQYGDDTLLDKVDSPIGTIYYHYQKPEGGLYYQLTKMSRDDQWSREYLYEAEHQAGNPYRLTGIVLHNPEKQSVRLNEWHYQEDGKAIYSQSNYPQEHRLFIHYEKEAQHENEHSLTIVKDANKHETHIKGTIIGGQYLLEEVSGDGCYLCPAVGTKATYDQKGQFTSINGFQIHRDEFDQVKRIDFEHPYWDKVSIHYNDNGYVKSWYSTHTGTQPPGPHKLIRYYLDEPPKATDFVDIKGDQLVYKNGLVLKYISPDPSIHTLSLEKHHTEGNPIWEHHRIHYQPDRIEQEAFTFDNKNLFITYEYGYDENNRLAVARRYYQVEKATPSYSQQESSGTDTPLGKELDFIYRWNKDGTIKSYSVGDKTFTPKISRDKQGLPTKVDDKTLIYGESKRIEKVIVNGKTIAQYTYDKHGRRIAKDTQKEHTKFSYHGNQLSREERTLKSTQITTVRDYVYKGIILVGFIEQQYDAKDTLLHTKNFYVHGDHIGQPYVVTDDKQAIHWRAYYLPTGKAIIIDSTLDFNLRQPGQYYDEETDWHDNYFRTYDPNAGHYLEPDPLGPIAWNEPYGYVFQQPRQGIDPLGLLLFAFDGTTNNKQSNTNVWKFYQLYDEDKFYKEGPGGIPGESLYDKITGITHGSTWNVIIPEHKLNLINYMARHNNNFRDVIPIDIVGFSRGAALGMIFANYVKSLVKDGLFHYHEKYITNGLEYERNIRTCVDLRYIGLFDTVTQLGWDGARNKHFDYSAAPEWELITHAIALNEYRHLLPITTYQGAENVVEQGFLGNHSDAGGVHVPGDLKDRNNPKKSHYGDLSHIPLAWAYTQAQQLGVPLKSLDKVATVHNSRLNLVQNPIMHNTYGEYYTHHNHHLQFISSVGYNNYRTLDRHTQFPNKNERVERQGKSQHLGDKVREEHLKAADVEFLSPHFSAPHVGAVGVYGKLNAKKYIDFLEKKLNWKSPLKVLE